jgi:hypothetical protein
MFLSSSIQKSWLTWHKMKHFVATGFRGDCKIYPIPNPTPTLHPQTHIKISKTNTWNVSAKGLSIAHGSTPHLEISFAVVSVCKSIMSNLGWLGRCNYLHLCNIWGFHGADYEKCRLLGYKNPVHTSKETQYVSATEPSQLMLCKIWGSHGGDLKNAVFWDKKNSSYLTGNTVYLSYRSQPVNVM